MGAIGCRSTDTMRGGSADPLRTAGRYRRRLSTCKGRAIFQRRWRTAVGVCTTLKAAVAEGGWLVWMMLAAHAAQAVGRQASHAHECLNFRSWCLVDPRTRRMKFQGWQLTPRKIWVSHCMREGLGVTQHCHFRSSYVRHCMRTL